MPGVSVVGSGNVGANTAFFVAESCSVDVVVCDLKEGLSTGKTLDMMEAAPLRRYRGRLSGADSIDAIAGSSVVVVAIGAVRTPGKKREELYAENAPLLRELAPRIARLAPESVLVVMTEPVDLLTMLLVRETKFPRTRVIGLGGVLDSQRLRRAVARSLGITADNVTTMVIGPHTDSMIGLPAYSRVGGIPLAQLLPAAEITRLEEETRSRGDEIVKLAGRTSSYYAPGAVAAEIVVAITEDLHRVLPVSILLQGEYGLRDVAMTLPAVIGKGGVLKVLQPKLTSDEQQRLSESAKGLNEIASQGGRK